MLDKKESKTMCQTQDLSSLQTIEKEKNELRSIHQQQYNRAMSNINIEPIEILIQKLIKNNILYDPLYSQNKKQKQMLIKIVKHSFNGQSFNLLVYFGPFTLNVSVLNCSYHSELHDLEENSSGRFGKVYFVNRGQQNSAIKCISINRRTIQDFLSAINQSSIQHINQQATQQAISKNGQLWKITFLYHLRQYCFYKIFSALQIGPKTTQLVGFDLVFFNNCIEFSLEICSSKLDKHKNNIHNQLLRCLKTMHAFRIVHRDIKPQNMLYSYEKKKFILSDFGTTQILNQQIGQTTLCKYAVGTPNFMSPEMLTLWTKGTENKFIDLYYNDLYGLLKSGQNFDHKTDKKQQFQMSVGDYLGECSSLQNQNLAVYVTYCLQNSKFTQVNKYRHILKRFIKFILICSWDPNSITDYFGSITWNKYLQPYAYQQSTQQDTQYCWKNYYPAYKKLQQVTWKQMEKLHQDKLKNLLTVSTIIGNNRQTVNIKLRLLLERVIEKIDNIEQKNYIFLKIINLLSIYIIQVPKTQTCQVLHLFCCPDCNKLVVFRGENQYSMHFIRKTAFMMIQNYPNLEQQSQRLFKLIKNFYEPSTCHQFYNFILFKKQDPIKSINLYFKILLDSFQKEQCLYKINYNSYLTKIQDIRLKQLLQKVLKFQYSGNLEQILQIQQIMNKFLSNQLWCFYVPYAYLYILTLFVKVHIIFGLQHKNYSIENQFIAFVLRLPQNLQKQQLKLSMMSIMSSIYDHYSHTIKRIQYQSTHLRQSFSYIDQQARTNQFFTYFIQRDKILSCPPYFGKQLDFCCKLRIFLDEALDLHLKESQLDQQLLKCSSLEQFAKNVQGQMIQCTIAKLFPKQKQFIIKAAKTVSLKLSYKGQMVGRILKTLTLLKLKFSVDDVFQLFRYVGQWDKMQPSPTKQEYQNLLTVIQAYLKSNMKSIVIRASYYFTIQNYQKLLQLHWIKAQQIQTYHDLYFMYLQTNTLFDFGKNQNQIKRAQDILQCFIQFIHQNNLNIANSMYYFNAKCLLSFEKLNMVQTILRIMFESSLNFHLNKCVTFLFQVILLQIYLKYFQNNTIKKLYNVIKEWNLLQDVRYVELTSLYVDIVILLINRNQIIQINARKEHEIYQSLLKIINKSLYIVSKCTSNFLRSNLCYIISKIYEIEKQQSQKSKHKIKSINFIFKPKQLVNIKKKRTIQRFLVRYRKSFITEQQFHLDQLYYQIIAPKFRTFRSNIILNSEVSLKGKIKQKREIYLLNSKKKYVKIQESK